MGANGFSHNGGAVPSAFPKSSCHHIVAAITSPACFMQLDVFSGFSMLSNLVLPAHLVMVRIALKKHPKKNNTEQLPIYPAWLQVQ